MQRSVIIAAVRDCAESRDQRDAGPHHGHERRVIRERTGVETRYFVDPGTSTTDLAVVASTCAIDAAGIARDDHRPHRLCDDDPRRYFPGAAPAADEASD